MNYLKQVQRGINYIEANLDFDIALSQVAKAACISQWHFQRIFKALTNETVKTYIRSRRLSHSLEKLLITNVKIIDIALSAGFETQESFTRAFKKAFDMTPNEYRKLGNKSTFLQKIEFNTEYLLHINQNISLQPKIYLQREMTLIGMKTNFYSVDSNKNNIAEKLPPLWSDFMSRINDIENIVPGMAYGVVRQTKQKTDYLEYYAVVEVSKLGKIPENMVSIKIPALRYAKFTHLGEVKNLDSTVNYIYSSWLLQSGMRHTYDADLEMYGSEYHSTSSTSKMYYAIPIK